MCNVILAAVIASVFICLLFLIPYKILSAISDYIDFNRTGGHYKYITMSYNDVKLFYQLDHSNFSDDYGHLYFIRELTDQNRPHYLPTFFREERIQVQLSFLDYRAYAKDKKKYQKQKAKQKEIEISTYVTKAVCAQVQKQIDAKLKTSDEQIQYVRELTKQIHENLEDIK